MLPLFMNIVRDLNDTVFFQIEFSLIPDRHVGEEEIILMQSRVSYFRAVFQSHQFLIELHV